MNAVLTEEHVIESASQVRRCDNNVGGGKKKEVCLAKVQEDTSAEVSDQEDTRESQEGSFAGSGD